MRTVLENVNDFSKRLAT
jgi:glucosamine 6-phosphate synthetase-like amidotransferase/phosphosugar isomerase protein